MRWWQLPDHCNPAVILNFSTKEGDDIFLPGAKVTRAIYHGLVSF